MNMFLRIIFAQKTRHNILKILLRKFFVHLILDLRNLMTIFKIRPYFLGCIFGHNTICLFVCSVNRYWQLWVEIYQPILSLTFWVYVPTTKPKKENIFSAITYFESTEKSVTLSDVFYAAACWNCSCYWQKFLFFQYLHYTVKYVLYSLHGV